MKPQFRFMPNKVNGIPYEITKLVSIAKHGTATLYGKRMSSRHISKNRPAGDGLTNHERMVANKLSE